MANFQDFEARSLSGDTVPMRRYAGKLTLVVNTASQCGLTPHYKGLQALHQQFAARGLAVLGFPCNQFGAQEPGDAGQIADFCQRNYGVDFAMFDKVEVNGEGAHPLWAWLTGHEAPLGGPITWNFAKFLIGPDGAVIKRYHPKTEPSALIADIEAHLPGGAA